MNTTSFVELRGGTLISRTPIVTDGVIRGSGRIESDLNIGSTSFSLGELRNFGTVGDNSPDQGLVVTGIVINDGTIQALGGLMEFQAPVTNNLEMIARDAEIHLRAGLVNNGVLTIGGDTIIHGDVDNSGGGDIFVLSDSESVLVGDLTFTGGSILALTIGPAAGTLDVTGAADLTGAVIGLDYSAGIASQVGDSYQIFQADGGITGAFPTVASADGRIWDIDLVGGDTLIATATIAAVLPVGADFNGDGIVNELDLLIWENNYPIASGASKMMGDADGDGDVDAADFIKIQTDFGVIPVPPISASVAVPEPATVLLALLAVAGCPRRRARGL